MSKGKQEMEKTITTRQLQMGDKFKIPGNTSQTYEVVNIKDDYLIYRNVRSHEEFQMVRGFASKVDLVEESATYQKKRFKEPYYMYNESKKVVENKMVGIISLPVGSKFIDDSFGGKRTLEVVKHGNDDIVHVKEVATGRKFAYDASTPGGNKKVEKIEEGCIKESFIIMDTINGKPTYFHYGKFTGYDWGFEKDKATKFSTKDKAEQMIEKMRQEGALVKDMKVIEESSKYGLITDVKVGDTIEYRGNDLKVIQKTPDIVRAIDDKGNATNFSIIHFNELITIKEGRIAKGYENLDAEEKARHLLSHPSSKYMNDLKSENITERAIRKAVKEMLAKPAKDDPQFITDVNEGCIKEEFYLKNSDGFYIKDSNFYHDFTDDKNKAEVYSSREEAEKMLSSLPRLFKTTFMATTIKPDQEVVVKSPADVYMKKDGSTLKLTGDKNQRTIYKNFDDAAADAKKFLSSIKSNFKIVQEEGEVPAIANTTANVENPDLPLKLKESTGQKLNITLIRKPSNMKEVESAMRKGYGDRVKAIVDKSYKLSGDEYDKFVYNFMVHTTYLSGEGGVDSDGTVHVIEITAPGRKTIYVDPEGYDYARYVGY